MSATKSLRLEIAGKIEEIAANKGWSVKTVCVRLWNDGYIHEKLMAGKGSTKMLDKVAESIDQHLEESKNAESKDNPLAAG